MLRVDDSLFPLVHVTMAKHFEEHQAGEFTAAMERCGDRAASEGVKLVVIINALWVDSVDPLARKVVAEWEVAMSEERFALFPTRVLISDRMVVRGAVTAMAWFSPRMRGLKSVSDMDAAIDHIRETGSAHAFKLKADVELPLRELDAKQTADVRI